MKRCPKVNHWYLIQFGLNNNIMAVRLKEPCNYEVPNWRECILVCENIIHKRVEVKGNLFIERISK